MNYSEHHLAEFTAILGEFESGEVGPETTAGACYVKLRDRIGVALPITVLKLQCQRIGLVPEQNEAGDWFLDLNNAAHLVAAAWGDDPEPEGDNWLEDEME